MKLVLSRVESILVYLLVFLLPTQLAYHFWPPSSFVFGIRVDFLAPAIYLTDILVILLLGQWFLREKPKLGKLIKKYKFNFLIGLAFVLANIIFSGDRGITLYKWLKIFELFGLFVYLCFNGTRFLKKVVPNALFYSLIFFSLVGIAQFFLGRTIGGPLYFFGERNFNISTPGIALTQIAGRQFLRAYSVFSHPNSLAGFFGASLITLLLLGFFKKTYLHILGFFVIIFGLLLTFSVSGLISLAIVFIVMLVGKIIFSDKSKKVVFGLVVVLSLLFPLISSLILGNFKNLGSSISERLNLSIFAGKMISEKFLTGEGLGTFIINIPRLNMSGSGPWLLQPVHNIFLLAFSELGFFGLLILCFVLYQGIGSKFFPVFLFILLTGFFDHYWLTLHQNLLLLTLILGVLH